MLSSSSNSAGESTMVVGWDGSDASRAAIATAARLAHGGRVIAVHARGASPREATAHWQELMRQDAAERSDALLRRIPPALRDRTALELRSVEGDPAGALQRVADELDADVIVVGSRGLGDAAQLVGSVSAELLNSADRPVLVVRGGQS